MIKIHDFRKKHEYALNDIDVGHFFTINNFLDRRCWWEITTFDRIDWEDECVVCMRMDNGELVVLRRDQAVELVPDRQIEISMED